MLKQPTMILTGGYCAHAGNSDASTINLQFFHIQITFPLHCRDWRAWEVAVDRWMIDNEGWLHVDEQQQWEKDEQDS